jgi:hypothetical protein
MEAKGKKSYPECQRRVQQISVVATKESIGFSDGSFWKLPLGQMLKHQDQVESDIPELGRTVLADFKKRIQFYLLVAAFRRSAFVVHGLPFITATRRGCVEADVGFHNNPLKKRPSCVLRVLQFVHIINE